MKSMNFKKFYLLVTVSISIYCFLVLNFSMNNQITQSLEKNIDKVQTIVKDGVYKRDLIKETIVFVAKLVLVGNKS
jgi:hypothetical protein